MIALTTGRLVWDIQDRNKPQQTIYIVNQTITIHPFFYIATDCNWFIQRISSCKSLI